MPNLLDMSKKTLKNYVNKNGGYFHINVNTIDRNEVKDLKRDNKVETGREIPTGENIMIFKGLASQKFKKGEKNRNGYKIDVDAWDFTNYNENPLMLFQHNSNYGGIGHAIAFNATGKGLEILFYIDLNTLEERNAYQVANGFVNALSTGHITHEMMIEDNKTGKRYTIEEAEEEGIDIWAVLFRGSDSHTMVVTKAEMVENSVVSIASNAKSTMTIQNSLEEQVTKQYLNSNYLSNNIEGMNKNTIEMLLKQDGISEEAKAILTAKLNSLEEAQNDVEEKEEKEEEVKEETKAEDEEVEEKEEETTEEVKEDEAEEENKEEEKEEEKEEDKKDEEVSEPNEDESDESDENSDDEAENADEDKSDKEENSVETNALVEKIALLTEGLNSFIKENKELSEENAELKETMAEAETLLNDMTPVVERAKKFKKDQGLAHNGVDDKKSILEKRARRN